MNQLRLLGATALVLMISAGTASADGQIVVNSFGGEFQNAQREAFFGPFQAATGITLLEDSGASLGTIKAAVTSGNVQWDLIMVASGDYPALVNEGLIESIDYSKLDPSIIDQLLPDAKLPSAIVGHFYACGIAYRTDLSVEGHPTNWAEFWDTERFPGPRSLPRADYWVPAWEAALLADGVAKEELYPLDFDRALGSFDKIKSSVSVWYNDTAAGVQALVGGEVDYAFLCHNRVVAARGEGASVDVEHNEAILLSDMWVIPKGAPNLDNVPAFLNFYSQAEPQAKLTGLQPVAPANSKSYDLLDAAVAADLSTAPQNVVGMVPQNGEFWGQAAPDGRSMRDYSIDLFDNWYGQ